MIMNWLILCKDRFTANDHFDAYLKAKSLFSEVRYLYAYAKVYIEYISDENCICIITNDGNEFNQ